MSSYCWVIDLRTRQDRNHEQLEGQHVVLEPFARSIESLGDEPVLGVLRRCARDCDALEELATGGEAGFDRGREPSAQDLAQEAIALGLMGPHHRGPVVAGISDHTGSVIDPAVVPDAAVVGRCL